MENLSKKQIIVIGIIIIVILIVVGYYFFTSVQKIGFEEIDVVEETEEISSNFIKQEKEIEEEKIIVHIAGAVNKEGIIKLNEGDRIADAIEKADGLTEDADITNVNLAYMLSDGQKIYIPHIEDEKEAEISLSSGENVILQGENESQSSNTLININTATLTQLLELPGVGSSTAQKIINYRNENGKFSSIDDIKNVDGIGTSKFNNIKEYICVK